MNRYLNFLLTKPYRIQLLSDLLTAGSPKTPERWFFLVGCYNSGTTLLLNLLDQHKDTSVLEGGVFRTNQLITPEELGWTRLYYKVKKDISDQLEEVNLDQLKRDWLVHFKRNSSVFIEKSISNTARIYWLAQKFPDAKFIGIIRNGYAVAEGVRRKAIQGRWSVGDEFPESYPMEFCIEQWCESLVEILDFQDDYDERLLLLKYEDLCENTQEEMDKAFKFLEIETVNIGKNLELDVHGIESKVKNMNPKSFKNISSRDIDIINSVGGDYLQKMGYELQ